MARSSRDSIPGGFNPEAGGSTSTPIHPGVKMSELRSKIMRPSLTSTYAVIVKQPKGWSFDGFDNELLELTCVEATLPGSSLGTIETNRDYRGVIEKHAYARLYDDTIDFTFLVTMDSPPTNAISLSQTTNPEKSYQQIKFFEEWMGYIIGDDKKNDTARKSPTYQTSLRYPEEYQAELTIVKFEKDLGFGKDANQNILVYEFVQAFPKAVSSMAISYDGSNLLKTTVSFTYTRYFLSSIESKVDSNYSSTRGRNPNSPGNPDVLNQDIASIARGALANAGDIVNRRSSSLWSGTTFKANT